MKNTIISLVLAFFLGIIPGCVGSNVQETEPTEQTTITAPTETTESDGGANPEEGSNTGEEGGY